MGQVDNLRTDCQSVQPGGEPGRAPEFRIEFRSSPAARTLTTTGRLTKERELLMRFLVKLMRGLHYTIGISTPPPEQERFYVFVWLAIAVLMVLFFLVTLWVLQ